jgi:hypothetical protein
MIERSAASNAVTSGESGEPKAMKNKKAASIAFARKILGSSENLVGVGKQEPKPEPGHGNHDA